MTPRANERLLHCILGLERGTKHAVAVRRQLLAVLVEAPLDIGCVELRGAGHTEMLLVGPAATVGRPPPRSKVIARRDEFRWDERSTWETSRDRCKELMRHEPARGRFAVGVASCPQEAARKGKGTHS